MKKGMLKTLSIALIVSLLTPDVAAAASLPMQTEAETVSENNAVDAIESGQDEREESREDIPEDDAPEIERALTYHDAEDPVPVMTRSEETVYANRGSLPSYYSSVEKGKVPALRNQGGDGTCWAFAAVGASESGLISRGLAGTGIDLSERHLAYYFYEKGAVGDTLGGTTGDYNRVLGGANYNYMNRGGNSMYTMWHLASWAGLVDESKAPYGGITTALPKTTADIYGSDIYHLQNAYIVNKENADVIKQLIMDYGSMAFSYYSTISKLCDNPDNDSYYFYIDDNRGTNHAVQVVGWDDNFSKDKFASTPPGDGAWLIKNSWGEEGGSYAQNGYFWMSYYDTSISDNFFAYVCEKGDNYDNIYQYDGASGNRYMYAKQFANVFTGKANANGIEKLEAVGIGTYSNGVSYTVDIYTDLTNSSDPASGTKVASQKGTLTYSGYHTIPLNTPVTIEEGQKFSVVFTFDKTSAVYVDYTYGGTWIEFVTNESLGTSFYHVGYAGESWIDAVGGSQSTFRIKAYTSNAVPNEKEPLQKIILDKSAITLDKGKTAQLKVTYRPSYTTDDKTIRWSSSNTSVATVDANGKITAVGPGTATITAACGTKTAVCTVTVKDIGVTVGNLNNDVGTFTVKATGINQISGVSRVQFAVWSEENGQDDLRWYTAANGGNGVYTQNISIKNHGSKAGKYIIHAYTYDSAGTARFFGATECIFTKTNPSVAGISAKVSSDEENVTITATGVAGMGTLKFAVWSDVNGQDDLVWYTATNQGGNIWTATVPISRHRYSAGRYSVHAYGENVYSSSRVMTATSFQISAPNAGKTVIKNVNAGAGTFTVEVSGVSAKAGIKNVRVAVWSAANQSNLAWYTAAKQSDGTYTAMVNIANHGYQYGTYTAHAYVTDNNGNVAVAGATGTVAQPKAVLTVVGNGNQTQFNIKASNVGYAGGVKSARVAVWSATGGQDDLVWYTMTNNGNGVWSTNVPISGHKTAGTYYAHMYIADKTGSQHVIASTTFKVDAPTAGNMTVKNLNNGAGTFNLELAGINAKAGVNNVRVAVWSTANQSNLKWYTAAKQSNGTYTVSVNIANHGYQYGTYTAHAYVTDNNGIAVVAGTTAKMEQPKAVLTAAGNGNQTQFNIKASNVAYAGGVKSARVAVWSATGGQDDLVWYTMTNNGNGVWSTNVPISKHKTAGTYYVHMYIADKNGTQHVIGSTTFKVDAPTVESLAIKNLNNGAGTFTVEASGITAKPGIDNIRVAVWSAPDQSNLKWYTAVRQSDGSYIVPVNIGNHGYKEGTYTAHAYITDKNGVSIIKGTTVKLAK